MDMFNLGVTAAEENQVEEGLVFNLEDVEEVASFEVLPKGTYDAVVEELEFTNSQSSGDPMLHVIYSIVGGEFEGRKLHDYFMLGGKGKEFALPRLKQFIIRVCPDVSLSDFNPKRFADDGIAISRMCRLTLAVQTVKKGEYKGEKRNTIREVMAANDQEGSFLG